jgi:hypothetical protein
VIIETDPPHPPLRVFVGFGRQRLQRRLSELEEKIAAADAETAHRPPVEIGDQFGDRPVQFGEREKTPVPQPCQDPALNDEHGDLDPRFREGRLFALSRGLRARAGRIAVR